MASSCGKLAVIALGANLTSSAGPPEATLRAALAAIAGENATEVAGRVRIAATLDAPALLALLHGVEAALGRTRDGGRWAARGIDLDLLAMGAEVRPDAAGQARWRTLPPDRQRVETPGELILPHPRLQDRAFVLAPLADIAPRWRHPLTGARVQEMLDALPPGALAEVAPFA